MSSKCRNCLPFAEIARNAQIDYLKKISANDYLKSECASTLIQMKNQTKATLTKPLFFLQMFSSGEKCHSDLQHNECRWEKTRSESTSKDFITISIEFKSHQNQFRRPLDCNFNVFFFQEFKNGKCKAYTN